MIVQHVWVNDNQIRYVSQAFGIMRVSATVEHCAPFDVIEVVLISGRLQIALELVMIVPMISFVYDML